MRSDIQGLRAVAVLMVILNHAGLPLQGGFLGVDVFFVISGFVISRNLLSEYQEKGSINLRDFYRRRFYRLFPPLAAVTTATLILSVLFESPFRQQIKTVKSAAAAIFLNANTFFFLDSGYFDPQAITNPLLHTWSLSVEEQTYLILPFIILLTAKTYVLSRFKSLTTFFVAYILTTLILSVVITYDVEIPLLHWSLDEKFAFYSPFTRLWEFLFGVLAALILKEINPQASKSVRLLGLVGAALVVGSSYFIDSNNRVPGIVAVIPVVGTTLLIVSGGIVNNPVSRWLANKTLVGIGNRSYSIYLWHWPLVVMASAAFPNFKNAPLVATILSFAPAFMTHRFIEKPIREGGASNKSRSRLIGLTSIAVPLMVMLIMVFEINSRWWLNWSNPTVTGDKVVRVGECIDATFDPLKCTWNVEGVNGRIILVGDSQAFSYADGVVEAATDLNYSVTVLSRSGCPFLTQESTGQHFTSCTEWQTDVLEWIVDHSPKAVLIANRSSGYTTLNPAWRTVKDSSGSVPHNDDKALSNYIDGLNGVISEINSHGIPVVILSNIPEIDVINRGESIYSKIIGRTNNDSNNGFIVDKTRSVKNAELTLANRFSGVDIFDPYLTICPNSVCSLTFLGKEVYMDSFHLTEFGSNLFAPRMLNLLKAIRG